MKKTLRSKIALLANGKKILAPIKIRYDRKDDSDDPVEITLTYEGLRYVCYGGYYWVDAFAELQFKLPEGVMMACCLTCKHGNRSPYGNGRNLLFCAKNCTFEDKADVCNWFDTTDAYYTKDVNYLHNCDNFTYQSEDYFTYNNFLYLLGEKEKALKFTTHEECELGLIQSLKDRFCNIPYDIDGIRKMLALQTFSKDELADLAIDFAMQCRHQYVDPERAKPGKSGYKRQSVHLKNVIALLLELGLDPNVCISSNGVANNVMWATTELCSPTVAPSVLKLLLEYGGDPMHKLPGNEETLGSHLASEALRNTETTNPLWRHTVQCLLILIAYGAVVPELKITENYDVCHFKDFHLFDFKVEKNQSSGTNVHIINLKTKKIVAII